MQASVEKIWAAALGQLRTMLSPDIYNLWFAPLSARALEENVLVLEVANDFCEVWLKDNYLPLLQEVLAATSGRQLQVKFKVATAATTPASSPSATPPAKGRNSENGANARSAFGNDLAFNPKNTFEAFVVGNNNNFAYAAALAVAQSPGKSYNPLFLYGGVGLGKNQAVGDLALEAARATLAADAPVFYSSAKVESPEIRKKLAKARMSSVLCVPMRVGDASVGAMAALSTSFATAAPVVTDAYFRADVAFPKYVQYWEDTAVNSGASGGFVHVFVRNTGSEPVEFADALLDAGLPTVDVSHGLKHSPFPRIASNCHTVARLAAEHLLERGFKHFA